MEITFEALRGPAVDDLPVEVVERKGLGHPDTICDALAEELSLGICRFHREHFGAVLHHNVDKVLLWAGSSEPAFGGGRVVAPLEIFLAGRAAGAWRGIRVPLEDLARDGSRRWLAAHLPHLDVREHVRIHALMRPGAAELVDVFQRGGAGAIGANDTSCGVGWAPLSRLDRVVDRVERSLSAASVQPSHAWMGQDIKVLGTRRGSEVEVTVACAFVGRHVASLGDYLEKKARLAALAAEAAAKAGAANARVAVNAADDPASGRVYLTVTGTSAESGDDGQAGRGNRTNGLITPFRPMTIESWAGKNPVNHVGKIYNALAGLVAQSVVEALPGIREAQCFLVSQIGRPIKEPRVAHVRLLVDEPRALEAHRARATEILRDQLDRVHELTDDLMTGRLVLGRWPHRVA
jgi:S-adenosylmethionine synthetase